MSRLICLCRDSLFLWGMVRSAVLRAHSPLRGMAGMGKGVGDLALFTGG